MEIFDLTKWTSADFMWAYYSLILGWVIKDWIFLAVDLLKEMKK